MARQVYIDGKTVPVSLPRGIFMAIRSNEQLKDLMMRILKGNEPSLFVAVSVTDTDPDTGFSNTEYIKIDSFEKLRKVVAAGGHISLQYAQPKPSQSTTAAPTQAVDFRALLA